MARDDHSVWNEPSTPGGSGPKYVCPQCEYDLSGTTQEPVCPECGLSLKDTLPSMKRLTSEEEAEHSVWNEATMHDRAPEGAVSFQSHLIAKITSTSVSKTWMVTMLAALAAGPFAIFGAIWGSGQSWSGVLSLVVFGPVVEEVMKISAALMIVELAPYLFRSRSQILLATVISGLVFSVIENFMYLKVYITDPSEAIILWRWTVCVALHSGCSLIAGIGVARVWSGVMREKRRADVSGGAAYLVTATVIHGVYNASMLALDFTDFSF